MNTVNTATEAKMPPTRKLAACWNSPSTSPATTAPRLFAHAAERDRHEAIESQQRRIGKEGEQHLPAGKARERADHAGDGKARHAQIAFGESQRACRVIVLGDCPEGVTEHGAAIEDFQPTRVTAQAIIGSQNC